MIMLGNFSIEQIQQRLGIILTDEEIKRFPPRCLKADVEKGTWHCFDVPYMIMCGDEETAIIIRDILTPHASEMKCPIDIGY